MADASNYFHKESYRTITKEITFVGGTANATGDYDGTGNPFAIFTVVGNVKVKVYAICTTTLVGGSSTLEIGTATATAAIIAQTTGTDIDVSELWHDASPDTNVEASSVVAEKIIVTGAANSGDIIGTVATANITAGVIKFICEWVPIDGQGNVTV